MSFNRRTFIKQVGLGLGTAYFAPSLLGCSSQPTAKSAEKEIGIQLYTLRNLLDNQLDATLARVAEIGYNHVETFGPEIDGTGNVSFWGASPQSLRNLLGEYGLKTYSGHYNLPDFLTPGNGNDRDLRAFIDTAAELGQEYVIVPAPPIPRIDQFKISDYEFIADQLNKGAELAAQSGIQIGYHNHFWEFRPFDGGRRGLDVLLTNTTDPVFELDLFWSEKSGMKSTDYFEKYPGRFPLWHVKDMDKSNTAPVIGPEEDKKPVMEIVKNISYAEVGTGSIDFKAIFAKKDTAGLQHIFVEQDIITIDPFESISKSYAYVANELVV